MHTLYGSILRWNLDIDGRLLCGEAIAGAVIRKDPGDLDFDLNEIGRQPIEKVSIQFLRATESPRSSGENAQHVCMLAEAEKNLPPIIVHRGSMRVIDGMHRLRAAQMRGEKEIEARFFEGDEKSCYVLSVKYNIAHGLPLSLSDRKAAAAHIVQIYPDWSDRMVASVAGIAPRTVATVRAARTGEAGGPSDQNNQLDTRVGRDGRRRSQNPRQRRELAERYIQKNPNASLRQIAQYAGVSPETARNVRASLTATTPSESKFAHSQDVGTVGQKDVKKSGGRRAGSTPSERARKRCALNFLRADPAFRSTENGRSLLRLLIFPELFDLQRSNLVSLVPSHCRDSVAEAAAECARAWKDFAAEIISMQGPLFEPSR